MANDEDDYEPPCPCGRQLIGILFGFIIGIITMILSTSNFIVALMLSLGVTFGSLGSEVFAPVHFNVTEFITLFGMNLVSSIALFMLFGNASFANILFICIIISSYILPVKMVFSIMAKEFKVDKDGITNVGKSCYPGDMA